MLHRVLAVDERMISVFHANIAPSDMRSV